MKIDIKAKNFELTDAIRDYIEDKMSYFDRFFEEEIRDGSAEVTFEVAKTTNHHENGEIYYAEANLSVPGKVIRGDRNASDLYVAIDEVKDVLAQEVRKFKEIKANQG